MTRLGEVRPCRACQGGGGACGPCRGRGSFSPPDLPDLLDGQVLTTRDHSHLRSRAPVDLRAKWLWDNLRVIAGEDPRLTSAELRLLAGDPFLPELRQALRWSAYFLHQVVLPGTGLRQMEIQ